MMTLFLGGDPDREGNVARAVKMMAAIKSGNAKALAEFAEVLHRNPDAAYELLKAAGLISAVIRNGVSAYDYPDKEHPAIKLWLASGPKKQRRTT